MPVANVNLPILVYQAEQAQLFQHQHDLIGRGALVAQAAKGDAEAELAERSVKETRETENPEIETRRREEGRRRREEGPRGDAADPEAAEDAAADDADVGPRDTPADLRALNRDGQGESLDVIV